VLNRKQFIPKTARFHSTPYGVEKTIKRRNSRSDQRKKSFCRKYVQEKDNVG